LKQKVHIHPNLETDKLIPGKQMRKKYLLYAAVLFLIFTGYQSSFGQSSTMYYMGAVPQSYFLNPATQPQCGFYLGFPGLFQVEYKNTGFSASDFIFKDENSDTVLHLLHPKASISDFMDKMKDVEHISSFSSANIVSFGFRVQDMFFSFDATVKVTNDINYPKSFFNFLLVGNSNGEVFNFKPFEFNIQAYTEMGINVSKQFGDMLSIGIRPKVLFGLATISNSNESMLLTTGIEEWNLDAKTELKIAAVGTTIPIDQDGVFDPNGDIELGQDIIDNGNYKAAFQNKGLGIDLGAHFKPYDEIQFSVSLLDIGYINWKNNTHIDTYSGSVSFEGIDLGADSINIGNTFDTIFDGLTSSGRNNVAFKTGLTPKLVAGGRFFLNEDFDIGLLSTTNFHKHRTTNDLTFVANLHPSSAFGLSASYSLVGKGHNTMGVGIGMRIGPFNFYLVSDYVPFYYDMLHYSAEDNGPTNDLPMPITYNMNLKLGVNLVFGYRKNKRLSQDTPLYNSSEWMF
jgi:hypothetical protein